jgi:hypothetical protein
VRAERSRAGAEIARSKPTPEETRQKYSGQT